MSEERWGIWGGRKPGGWCAFEVGTPPRLAIGHVGTRAQAEAGFAIFEAEKVKYRYGDDVTYELVCFDPEKLPEADEKTIPSKAQAEVLRSLIGADSSAFNRLVSPHCNESPPKRKTMDIVKDRGWLHGYVDEEENDVVIRTTPAGERALSRYESKEGRL